MLKKVLIFLFFMNIFVLLSCSSNKIIEIDNITWKCDFLNIIATSEELQNPANLKINKKKLYSSLTIDDKEYSCIMHTYNHLFGINLYNSFDNSQIDFYNVYDQYGSSLFLFGTVYNPKRAFNKEYKYYFVVELRDECQYYDYCVDNNIEYPETITFYGYEN